MPSSVAPLPARPKCPAFPAAGCAVLRVTGTMPGSDSLCPADDFGSRLIRRLAAVSPTRATADRRASPVDPTTFRTCHDLYTGEYRARSKLPRPAAGFAKSTEARHSRLAISVRQSSLHAAARSVATSSRGMNTALRHRDLSLNLPLATGLL